MDNRIIEYYRRRVTGTADVYGPPEIQEDFVWVTQWLHANVAAKNLLEVACGAGHWTRVASETARRIVASDVNENLVLRARQKTKAGSVDFLVADAYELPLTSGVFDCALAAFWLSHVPRSQMAPFLDGFLRHLKTGGRLFVIDARWVEGYRKGIDRRDQDGNTYELRTLKDGSQYEVLKNYFTRQEWLDFFERFGRVQVQELSYVWAVDVSI
jgi:ubiquinone/menaquinone biosynthesis C-methylase UbiE